MTTKLIGIKDFRKNISQYAQKAKQKKVRYIVTNRNVPLFEVVPFDDEEISEGYASFLAGLEDIKHGRVVSQEEILKKYSLNERK